MTRALLSEARRHDAAMTEGPWSAPEHLSDYGANAIVVTNSGKQVADAYNGTSWMADQCRDNAAAIAWLRTNLKALLDAYEQALGEVERLTDADGRARVSLEANQFLITENYRLRSAITALHTDAERWLTESDDRPNLRAAAARLAAMIGGAP